MRARNPRTTCLLLLLSSSSGSSGTPKTTLSTDTPLQADKRCNRLDDDGGGGWTTPSRLEEHILTEGAPRCESWFPVDAVEEDDVVVVVVDATASAVVDVNMDAVGVGGVMAPTKKHERRYLCRVPRGIIRISDLARCYNKAIPYAKPNQSCENLVRTKPEKPYYPDILTS